MYSKYVINGVQQDLVPAEILSDCGQSPFEDDGLVHEPIVDETPEPSLTTLDVNPEKINEYLAKVSGAKHGLSLLYSDIYTRQRVALALIDTLWKDGNFRLEDLSLDAEWKWADLGIGSMASFYNSVSSAAEYIDGLFLRLRSYRFEGTKKECGVSFKVASDKKISSSPLVPSTLKADKGSWIVYIPFENCPYRLGGSLLQQELGIAGGIVPKIGDADYFMDCYEVVRELVEDGVVMSAVSVCDGGLLNALKKMATSRTGAQIDVSGIMRSVEETNSARILFAEIPGVIIQIADVDFDYLDAELLLQDVAFFPLGHPVPGGDIRVNAGIKTGIQTILESLMLSQGAEGED